MNIKHPYRILPSVAMARRLILSAILAAAGSSLSLSALAADSNTSYDFYGFVQLDAIYDFNRMVQNGMIRCGHQRSAPANPVAAAMARPF